MTLNKWMRLDSEEAQSSLKELQAMVLANKPSTQVKISHNQNAKNAGKTRSQRMSILMHEGD